MDREDAVRQWCEWILYYGEADGPPGNQNPKAARQANKAAIERACNYWGCGIILRNSPGIYIGLVLVRIRICISSV